MLLIILLCIFITSDQVTAQSWNRRSTSIFNTPKFRVRAHDLFVRFLLLTTRMCIELHDFQGIPQECLWGSRGEQRVNHYQQVHAILGHEVSNYSALPVRQKLTFFTPKNRNLNRT